MPKVDLLWRCEREYGGYITAISTKRKDWQVMWLARLPSSDGDVEITTHIIHVASREKARQLARFWAWKQGECPVWLKGGELSIIERRKLC